MTEAELLFVSQTLLSSAFYFGVFGGLVGAALVPAGAALYRAARRLFQWR